MKNLAHSIAQRLLNVSKKDGADNTLVSMRYAAGDQKAALAREFSISRETLYQYLRTVD